jgi:hypothetical protein
MNKIQKEIDVVDCLWRSLFLFHRYNRSKLTLFAEM